MASADQPGPRRRRRGGWLARLVSRPGVQDWAARLPFGARLARRDGAEIFDILQGFVSAQVLAALVELGVLDRLLDGAQPPDVLGAETGIAADRMAALLQAAGRRFSWQPAPPAAIPEVVLDTARLQALLPVPLAVADPAQMAAEWAASEPDFAGR